MSELKAEEFRIDLEAKPGRLRDLAELVAPTGDETLAAAADRGPVVLLGMGSSHYANQVAAARQRARGRQVVAELASSDLLPALGPDSTVMAVSASGGSVETLDAVTRLRDTAPPGARFVALTNRSGTALESLCDQTWSMAAGEEIGGVACRSFQHTLALLLGLDAGVIRRAAEACEDLLEGSADWLEPVSDLLLGPSGTHVVAPAHRISSAYQSALMLREGPRLAAIGCETGDWSHVDVYLTKTTDYRMLLMAGSHWEANLLEWTSMRGTTVVALGGAVPGAAYTLRHRHDAEDDVRLLTETLVCELVAARAWLARS